MGGFSIWHWFVLLVLVGMPFLLLFLVIRSGVRSGMRAAEREREERAKNRGDT